MYPGSDRLLEMNAGRAIHRLDPANGVVKTRGHCLARSFYRVVKASRPAQSTGVGGKLAQESFPFRGELALATEIRGCFGVGQGFIQLREPLAIALERTPVERQVGAASIAPLRAGRA